MASQFRNYSTSAILRTTRELGGKYPFVAVAVEPPDASYSSKTRPVRSWRIRVSDGGDSYMDMWKKAVVRDRKSTEFERLVGNSTGVRENGGNEEEDHESPEVLERKSNEFFRILEVSPEERDRIQRMQVIDRAAAAIAAARSLLQENVPPPKLDSDYPSSTENLDVVNGIIKTGNQREGMQNGSMFVSQPKGALGSGAPGPDFWSWKPPPVTDGDSDDESKMNLDGKSSLLPNKISPVMEKEQSMDILSIPFESKLLGNKHNSTLPPLQSLMEAEKGEADSSSLEKPHLEEERDLGYLFSANAAEAAHALSTVNEESHQGVHPNGSRWWKETGTEQRPDGVICKWTLLRGVSADDTTEWEEKYWEAVNEFDYKELGSEKSGRDAYGNVWREYWKESMWQVPTFSLKYECHKHRLLFFCKF